MGFLYEALAPNFLESNPKITFFHFLQFLFLPTHLSLRVSSIPKNVHNLNNLVCLSALSTSSFLSYIFFFFLNDLILLFPFLSMFPHGLVFSHVRLYLLLCHLVHLKFFLTFLFSVVFTLSEGYLCHLLNFLIFFFFLLFKASPPSPHLQSLYFTPISFSCLFKSVSFSSSPLQLSDF